MKRDKALDARFVSLVKEAERLGTIEKDVANKILKEYGQEEEKLKICPKWFETSNLNLGKCRLRSRYLCTKIYAERYFQKCNFLTSFSKEKEENHGKES